MTTNIFRITHTGKRVNVPQHIREKILERDAYICAYCDEEANEVDHVIPYSYSQCNDEFNLVACCRDCNAMVYNLVFPSLEEKRMWIRNKRSRKKWVVRRMMRVSTCVDCGNLYNPGKQGATRFLCEYCYANHPSGWWRKEQA